jgi:hypothetical protein
LAGGEIVITARRITMRLRPCQIGFFKSNLERRGLPTGHLSSVKFVSGLDRNANWQTRLAYNSGVRAVTQFNTIYVNPRFWREVTDFITATGFEEVYHTAQFAQSGANFYEEYGAGWLGSEMSGLGGYGLDVTEAFAKGAADQMADEAESFMCH